MKIRAVAAAALALALGAGLAGCNMISPQRTTMQYAASDGVHVDLGDVAVRNVLLIVDTDTADATEANLVFTAVNTSSEDAQLTVSFAGDAPHVVELPHDAQSNVVHVGWGEGGVELVTGSFTSGTTVEATFKATYTDRDGQRQTVETTHLVPVLGADDPANVLEEYQTLNPGSAPEPTMTTLPVEPTATEPAETEEPVQE